MGVPYVAPMEAPIVVDNGNGVVGRGATRLGFSVGVTNNETKIILDVPWAIFIETKTIVDV